MEIKNIKFGSILFLLFTVLFLSGCTGGDSLDNIENQGENGNSVPEVPMPGEIGDITSDDIIEDVVVPEVEEDVEIGDLI